MTDELVDLLPQEVEDKLIADYGDFAAVRTVLGFVAMRSATKQEYNRFYVAAQKENERAVAQENLAFMCCIYANGVFANPSDARTGQNEVRAALKVMLDKRPGMLSSLANCALEASGVDGDAATKKYGAS